MEIKISLLVIMKIKINLIQKKLCNELIDPSKFKEEYNKFLDNIAKFEYYKSKKELGSFSPNQKKMIYMQEI